MLYKATINWLNEDDDTLFSATIDQKVTSDTLLLGMIVNTIFPDCFLGPNNDPAISKPNRDVYVVRDSKTERAVADLVIDGEVEKRYKARVRWLDSAGDLVQCADLDGYFKSFSEAVKVAVWTLFPSCTIYQVDEPELVISSVERRVYVVKDRNGLTVADCIVQEEVI